MKRLLFIVLLPGLSWGAVGALPYQVVFTTWSVPSVGTDAVITFQIQDASGVVKGTQTVSVGASTTYDSFHVILQDAVFNQMFTDGGNPGFINYMINKPIKIQ